MGQRRSAACTASTPIAVCSLLQGSVVDTLNTFNIHGLLFKLEFMFTSFLLSKNDRLWITSINCHFRLDTLLPIGDVKWRSYHCGILCRISQKPFRLVLSIIFVRLDDCCCIPHDNYWCVHATVFYRHWLPVREHSGRSWYDEVRCYGFAIELGLRYELPGFLHGLIINPLFPHIMACIMSETWEIRKKMAGCSYSCTFIRMIPQLHSFPAMFLWCTNDGPYYLIPTNNPLEFKKCNWLGWPTLRNLVELSTAFNRSEQVYYALHTNGHLLTVIITG